MVASSPAEVAEAADLVIVNLTDHAATLSVLETEGVAAALRGKTLVQTAMTTSAEVEALAAWAAANGVGFLGAFIFTYPMYVLKGAGNLVYAGPKRLLDAHLGIFEAFDAEPWFLSTQVGAAVISSFFGCVMSYFHGAAMAERRGIPIELFTGYAAEDAVESMNA